MNEAVRDRTRNPLSLIAVALAAVVLVVSVAAAWGTGAHRLPYSDDWAYLKMQDTLDRTGHIIGVGWNDVSLVGQLRITRAVDFVLDDSVLSSRVVVIASGIACVALLCWLIGRTRRRALRPLAALSFVAFPGMANILVTSMTDLPATALMLGCLGAGMAAPAGQGSDRRIRLGPLVAAVALGVAAITIRQVAAAAPIAVIGMLLVMPQQRRSRWTVAGIGAAGAALALAFLAWRSGIDRVAPNAAFQPFSSTGLIIRSWSLLGLGLLPLLIAGGAIGRWWTARRDQANSALARAVLTAGPALWFFIALASGWNQPVSPTILVREGPIGTVSLGTLSTAQSDLVWHAVSVVGAVAGTLLTAVVLTELVLRLSRAGVAGQTRRLLDEPSVVLPLAFAAVTYVVIALSSYLQHAVWDRYLLPMLAASMLLVCMIPRTELAPARTRVRREIGGLAVASVLAIAALWSVTDWDAFQSARFDGAGVAAAHGIPVGNIDAGFEYVGINGAVAHPIVLETDESYLHVFSDFRRCAFVTSDPEPPEGMREIGTIRYRAGFGLLERTVHIYASPTC
jgi:hypothetical protein